MTSSGTWRIISPSAPGIHDGIGDFAGALCDALQPFHDTSLVVRRESWHELDAIDVAETGAAIVQYLPQAFMHGDLRALLRWLGRVRAAGAPVVLMVHEYWPPQDGTLRRSAVRFLFRRVLGACLRRSSAIATSQEFSAGELHAFSHRPVSAIPVGSNIPRRGPRAPEAGCRVVVFGQPAALHAPTMAAIGDWLRSSREDVSLTWLGRSSTEMQASSRQWAWPMARVRLAGGLPAAEVSAVLSASTIALAPYENGASTRRTTFAACLQHELPVVAVDGLYTSDWLRQSHACVWTPEGSPSAFVAALAALADDPVRQRDLSARAGTLFTERLAWPCIGAAYAQLLTKGEAR